MVLSEGAENGKRAGGRLPTGANGPGRPPSGGGLSPGRGLSLKILIILLKETDADRS